MIHRNNSNINTQLDYIDLCKAIGILLVILGHTYGIPDLLYKIIYSFHMPLFFIISGFLYNEKKYSQYKLLNFIIKRFKNYLIPYFAFGFINLFLQILWNIFILKENITLDFILHNLKGIILCYSDKSNMPNCSPIWFLMCLFVSSIIFFIILKYANSFSLYIFIFCMFSSYFIYLFANYNIPWKISTSLMAVFFMYLGYIIRKYSIIDKILNLKLKHLYFICLGILGITAAFFNDNKVGMNENTYGNLFLFLVSSITLSILLLVICKEFVYITHFLLWLGKNTMIIIGFNFFLRDLTTEIYYYLPIIKNFTIHWTVSFLFTTLACIIFDYVYFKIHKKIVANYRRKLHF